MNREDFLDLIRRAAQRNGGRPPGVKAFYRETGTGRSDMFDAGFATYNSAVQAAGYEPNELTPPLDRKEALDSLARLVREIRRFPAQSDIKVARRSDPSIPSYEALFRIAGGGWRTRLPRLLAEHCAAHPEFADVIELLGDVESDSPDQPRRTAGMVKGYVYLARMGDRFKIGRSNDVARRRREISLLLPDELEHVHVIETDDPEGIERYWHERFKERRVRGEWFALTSDDVAAFRRRRFQ